MIGKFQQLVEEVLTSRMTVSDISKDWDDIEGKNLVGVLVERDMHR